MNKLTATGRVQGSKTTRHPIPLEVILFHMVDFRNIKGLPSNQDCTNILYTAAQRVLERMFKEGELYVESFMPRCNEFQVQFAHEIIEYSRGGWQEIAKVEIDERMAAYHATLQP